MHNFSYDFGDHYFEFRGYRIAFRVFTLENTYTLDPTQTQVETIPNGVRVKANGFFAAGRQIHCRGTFQAKIQALDEGLSVIASATHPEKIKSLGVLLKGVPAISEVISTRWGATNKHNIEQAIPVEWPEECVLRYTEEGFPIFFFRVGDGNRQFYAMNMDDQIRQKRFAIWFDKNREQVIDLIFVENARHFRTEINMPEWRFGPCLDIESVYQERLQLMKEKWGLRSWEERKDIPNWARKISLVLNMHGEHWTGYVFNTFNQHLDILRFVTKYIPGERVLVYLPGWDGRYYYNYPLYQVSERMGGETGFKRLVDGAHEMGLHVVPMFGTNGANMKWLHKLGLEDAISHTAQGWEDFVNFVDWDNDRSGQEQVHWLNMGHKGYQDYMFNRASELIDKYGVDGVFYDISHWHVNDPKYDFFEGFKSLCLRIRERYSQILLFGEGWYDALLPLIPLFHSQRYPLYLEAFTKYARMAGHLRLPAPGAGSSGVHERGFECYKRVTFSPILIPTLSIVDDTLSDHKEEVLATIEVAKEYARKMGI
ncbi:hypothetical protein CEE34_01240 [Candidatus Aerophobetes bacterium Ae_b3a]|nr:MAG: hypothetical protein CEE34_01240 [Candidatus Aerophobetes bacterium Ae_b3a]